MLGIEPRGAPCRASASAVPLPPQPSPPPIAARTGSCAALRPPESGPGGPRQADWAGSAHRRETSRRLRVSAAILKVRFELDAAAGPAAAVAGKAVVRGHGCQCRSCCGDEGRQRLTDTKDRRSGEEISCLSCKHLSAELVDRGMSGGGQSWTAHHGI